MQPHSRIIEGAYIRDLLAQPHAIADTVQGLRDAPTWNYRAQNHSKLVLTGMGSSLHALHPMQIRLVRSGHVSIMIETAELIHTQSNLLNDETLLVVVSQSGRSIETLQLLSLVRERVKKPLVVGVTNTPDSPLAREANAVVMMRAGEESSVSCKTYLATLVALEWLGAALCADDLTAILSALPSATSTTQAYLSNWRQHVAELMTELDGVKHLFITGRGGSLAAVGTGGLTLKESAHFHVEGMSCPAFRHGPFEMTSTGVYVIVLSGEPSTAPLNEALVRDVRAVGGRAALVSDSSVLTAFRLPTVPEIIRPIMEMLPLQMVSLALAANAGREAGFFERGSKVTTTA
jgi:glucosamine--fructose-6-phosphate aminotransferase (isomerizing)